MVTHYDMVTHHHTATPRIVTSREKTSSPARLALGALMASACMIGAWTASEGNFWTSSPFYSAATSQSTDDFGVVEQVRRIRLRTQQIDPDAIAATRGEAIVMFLLTLGDQSYPAPDLPVYEVKIRMDDGSVLATRESGVPAWRVGDRVKVVGNRIVALS